MDNNIWIAWERQRRSVELSREFGCKLFILDIDKGLLPRYFLCIISTLKILLKTRPKVVFVQNPSLLLALQVVLLKPFFKYLLIVDRHTNFKFDKRHSANLKWMLFWCVSNFTIRHADFTIVTNEPLKRIIRTLGGKGLVLQDKLPNMEAFKDYPLIPTSNKTALFVCTFAYDEPVDEIIKAFSLCTDKYSLYISGNWRKKWANESGLARLPKNIFLTGFLAEDDYKSLMSKVDAVIVFTTNDYTLTCGSYEALSLAKPALLSNKKVLVDYFGESSIYCNELSVSSISNSLDKLFSDVWLKDKGRIEKIISIGKEWDLRVQNIKKQLGI